MSRKGLSDVVTTILVILVAMAAVVIMWNVILPLMDQASGLDSQAYSTKLSVSPDSVSLDPNTNLLSLNVDRDAGDGDIAGFMFGFQDPEGNVKTFRRNFTIGEYERKNFVLNYTDLLLDDVLSVTITPIFRQNGTNKETFGIPIQQPVKNKTAFRLPGNITAYWRFDGNWVDSIHQGGMSYLDASSVGGAGFSSNNKFGGQSGTFGVASTIYASVPNNPSLNTGNFTVIAWVYPVALTSTSSRVMDKMSGNGGFSLRYYNPTGNWEFLVRSGPGNTNQINLPGDAYSNKWEFLAASFNSTSISLYLNGDTPVTQTPTYPNMQFSTGNLLIGPSFNGQVDEVMFFNRSLTSSEINDIRRKYKG